MPGYPEENSKVRMMSYRHYSDFKALRAELLSHFKTKQKRVMQQAPVVPPPKPSDDVFESILSRLPFHRPKNDRASDVMCGMEGDKEDRNHDQDELPERYKQLLPKFPRHALRMAMDCDDTYCEAKQQVTIEDHREEFLRQWVSGLFAKQGLEDSKYRTILRKFLTN